MSDTPLDSLTGKDASTLNVAQLAERLAMERALREQGTVYLRELVADKEAALNKALLLQAKEYERRLESLNGEAGRLAKVLADSIPREVFENYKTEHAASVEIRQSAIIARSETALDVLDKRLTELTLWRSSVEGRIIGIGAAFAVVVIAVNIALRFL